MKICFNKIYITLINRLLRSPYHFSRSYCTTVLRAVQSVENGMEYSDL